jgi:hypothetical protein
MTAAARRTRPLVLVRLWIARLLIWLVKNAAAVTRGRPKPPSSHRHNLRVAIEAPEGRAALSEQSPPHLCWITYHLETC